MYCINSGIHKDTIYEEIKRYSDYWIDITEYDDMSATKVIADLQLDIIIELGGYTGGTRLGVLCSKCAPIQLSYLGYFAPTYLKTIDGWIGDKALFHGNSKIHKEAQQLNVKGGYMAYEETIDAEIRRVNDRYFRVGTFNHSRKLNDITIKLFSKILAISDQIKLVLKSISFDEQEGREQMLQRLTKFGIDKNRIEILPWVEGRKLHLECYKYIDIALDPLPYGGATTTCEALFMGVPTITLRGSSMVENLSASILEAANKGEWIASDEKEYIKIARKLFNAGINNKTKRIKIAREIRKENLANTKRLANDLEEICHEVKKLEKRLSSEFMREEALPSSPESTLLRQ